MLENKLLKSKDFHSLYKCKMFQKPLLMNNTNLTHSLVDGIGMKLIEYSYTKDKRKE